MDDASPLHLDKNLGAAFLGNVIVGILYGVTCLQALKFFRKSNPHDSFPFRTLIFFLWSLDTSHVALITHALYYYLISNYGNIYPTKSAVWSIISQVFLSCTSDVIIRSFFARRVWLMRDRNDYYFVFIIIPSLLSFATACAAAIRAFDMRVFENMIEISYLIYLSLAAGVSSDILIAANLLFRLWRSRTGMKSSDSILNVLMLFIINTALLTTLCSIACLVTFAIWPQELIYIAIYFSLSKLYLNSLLATLNNRAPLSHKFNGIANLAPAAHPPEHTSSQPQESEVITEWSFSRSQTPSSEAGGITTTTLSSDDHRDHGLPIWHRHRRPSFDTVESDPEKQQQGGRMRLVENFVIQNPTPHSGFRFPLARWFKGQET